MAEMRWHCFYLSCECMIFQETLTGMDVKTAHFDIISMADKSTDSGKLMSIY